MSACLDDEPGAPAPLQHAATWAAVDKNVTPFLSDLSEAKLKGRKRMSKTPVGTGRGYLR
jgi:hypothetical protein